MFVKLNKPFVTPIYAVTHGLKTFTGVTEDGERKGIEYKKIWSPDANDIYGVLPKQYWEDFHLTVMTINTRIPPHTDSEIVCTINFYIQTDGCETVYYKLKTDNPTTVQIENQTNGYIFKEEELEYVDSFIAQPNEVWLLDASKIHSVEPPPDFKFRKAVTLGTSKHSFKAICEMLKETGNL